MTVEPRDRPQAQPVSFRDPAGALAVAGTRVLRAVYATGKADFEDFVASQAGRQLLADGQVAATTVLDLAEPGNSELAHRLFGCSPALLLEHDPIAFPSYPHEWPAEMLRAAAQLTLHVARLVLKDGFVLKDATPSNVLFRGPTPVFVDVLSFEHPDVATGLWYAEAQFVRTFILPLLVHKHFGVAPHQHFIGHRDGISPEDAYALTGRFRRMTPSFLRWVTVPTWMGRTVERGRAGRPASRSAKRRDEQEARFILDFLFRRLERAVASLVPDSGRRSTWSAYEACTHYDRPAGQAKESFVASQLDRVQPATVLDLGCNTGRFSRLAAQRGASVVAVDLDPVVVGRLWRVAAQEHMNILPLVQNIAMPSPAIGWWNREYPSFLDRAAGRAEMVLMLALSIICW